MSSDFGVDPGLPRGVIRERRSSRLTGRLVFGALLVTLGLLWTLQNLGLADADQVLRWWPALVIGYGLLRLTGLDGTRRVTSGVLFVLAGSWMLLRELGIVQVSIFRLWPVFMIAIGSSLVWRSMRGPAASADPSDARAYPRPFAFLGGNVRTIDSQELVGLEATAVMGGVEADLRGARARGSEVTAEVFAWWGGIDLVVPPDWRVVSEVVPIMGGVDDRTRPADGTATTTLIVRGVSEVVPIMGGVDDRTRPADGTATTTLIVRGVVIMGGLDIKNERREHPFRGVRVGVVSSTRSGRRKEVRVDATGVTITRDDGPPPPQA